MGGGDIFDNWVTQFQRHYISRTGEMYIGHGRLCVCLSIRRRISTLLHGPRCNLREW